MSILFTDTITVYNYHRDPETEQETWIRSIIKGVQWRHNKSVITISGNVQTESKIESITIDFQRNYGNKPYISPVEFLKLTADQAEQYWTLNNNGQDMIVLGVSDKDITSEYRISALHKDFQYAVAVTEVSDNRSRPRLKNIKAVGK